MSSNFEATAYRSIQILALLANQIQQRVFMIILILAGTLVQSLSATTLIKLPWSAENLIAVIVFSVVFSNCALVVVVTVGGFAEIHSKSGSTIHLVKQRNENIQWRKRFYKSCIPIKIKFGSINFIERQTPLVCIDYANALTLQLLLISQ